MPELSSRQAHLSRVMDSTLRLTGHLPSPVREQLYWWLFRKPFLHRRTPEQLAFLAQGRPFFVPSGPYLLKGFRYPGKGPTVVLVHGWQGSAASWFQLTPLLLEAGFSVVTFHAPGHSGRPRVATLPVYAQGLADVVSLFSPVHALVGHSFGGMASARVAQNLPDLKALVLLGTPDRTRTLVDNFARRMAMSESSLANFERRLQKASDIPIDQESTSLYVGNVKCPILVLHDKDDNVIDSTAATSIAEAGRAILQITEGLGHRAIIRDPATLARVADFVLNPPAPA